MTAINVYIAAAAASVSPR